METVAGSFLSFGVEKVWDLLVRESDRIKGVDEQLTELKNDLGYLRSFLKDADAKKHTMVTVKSCVEEIKEIAFDAEDIIETFLLRQELSGIKQRMRKLSRNIVDRRKFALEMEGISKRISKVTARMKSYDVQQMSIDVQRLERKQREIRKQFPSNNETNLVGLEENVKKLVGYLVEENSIQVVSITGMGGLGKTTLARQVFNHEMVKKNFNRVAWVCISQEFTRKDVWQTIFQKLSSKDDEQRDSNMTEDELQEKLFRQLETSNSLIVLDDLWKEEDWDMIKHVFPPKKGWKILLTSRNEKVALHVDPTGVIVRPEYLSIEDSWTLFQMTTFPRKDTSEYKVDEEIKEKEEMGKQMIKHCGGLPLAVILLGGLLAEQYTLIEWKRIFQKINSHIVGGTSFNDRSISSVFHILHMSFEELPLYLKHCFLYLSHFPEDFTIDMEDLAYYWAAEEIPRPKFYIGATIREVADGYIAELVKRNMVISKRDKLTSRFQTCRLHDMMREVCLRKAEDENFLQIVHNTSTTSFCKSRRLAVHLSDETSSLKEEMTNPKLRSVLIITNWWKGIEWMISGICFKRLQLMRVLDLSWAKFKGRKLPSSIGKLIHLRYLSLFSAEVSYLPSSMRNLKKLLYLNLNLDIDSRSPIYMPNFMKDMRELAYLYLPEEIDDNIKLELGNLVNLEALKNFSTKNSSVKDLYQMTRLRTLSIKYNGGGCTMETLSSSLSGLSHLENLEVHDYKEFAPRNNEEGFVLECNQLKQLDLSIYMPKLPDEQHFLSHLTTIFLRNCCLKEDPMPILEKLLQLQEVKLWSNSFCGRRMVCSAGGFPKLQILILDRLYEWEEWIVEEGSMPLLHTLYFMDCPKLKLPDGLRLLFEGGSDANSREISSVARG